MTEAYLNEDFHTFAGENLVLHLIKVKKEIFTCIQRGMGEYRTLEGNQIINSFVKIEADV